MPTIGLPTSESSAPVPRRMLDFPDGDTLSIRQPMRMVSADTPEKEYGGIGPTAQAKLNRPRDRLESGWFPMVPDVLAEYLTSRLGAQQPGSIKAQATRPPKRSPSCSMNGSAPIPRSVGASP